MGYIPRIKEDPTFYDVQARWCSFPEFYKRIPHADTYKTDKETNVRGYLQQFWDTEDIPISIRKEPKRYGFGDTELKDVEFCQRENIELLEKKIFPLEPVEKKTKIKSNSLLSENDYKRINAAKRVDYFAKEIGLDVDALLSLMVKNCYQTTVFLTDSVKVVVRGLDDDMENKEVEVFIEPSFIIVNENYLRAIRDGGSCRLYELPIEDFERWSYIEDCIEGQFVDFHVKANRVRFVDPFEIKKENVCVTGVDQGRLKILVNESKSCELISEAHEDIGMVKGSADAVLHDMWVIRYTGDKTLDRKFHIINKIITDKGYSIRDFRAGKHMKLVEIYDECKKLSPDDFKGLSRPEKRGKDVQGGFKTGVWQKWNDWRKGEYGIDLNKT